MGLPSSHEVTRLLKAWSVGDEEALEKLTPLVYKQLHQIAQRYMAGERSGHTLQTTALVNEAYLRLVDCGKVNWQDRTHFFAVSAQLMRRILIDAAKGLAQGHQPPALAGVDGHDFRNIRAVEKILEAGESWQCLGTWDDPTVQESMAALQARE